MTAMSYFTDLAHAITEVGGALFIGAVIFIFVWTCAGIGERHVRRVEHRKAIARWQHQQSRARVVRLRESSDVDRAFRGRSSRANDRVGARPASGDSGVGS